MARKKNADKAKIEAVPVLKAQGEDPTPVTPSITKSYCVRDDWKDNDIVNYVTFKSVDGEVQDLTVNGEPAGGGGISTARVSITNNLSVNLEIIVPYYFNEDERELIIGRSVTIPRSSSQNVVVAMGSNGAIMSTITLFNNAECSGGTEPDGSDILVTGDGTVIFS